MSLKAELETWAAALKAYDEEDFDKALDLFSRIADSSKILTNIGLIYATLGEHEAAVERFNEATALDQYLAVAYFQCGVSNFLLARYELALKDFEEALLYLRGNQAINYEQLGLQFRLYSAEVLFNKGLSQIYLGQLEPGMADLEEARKDKATDEHNVIDDAIADRGDGYTVFSIPVGVLYRPSEKKLKNAGAKDYLGKARLIAASDSADEFTAFTGVTRLQQGISPQGVFVPRPDTAEPAAGLARSQTVPAAVPPKRDPDGPALVRSKTTLTVPANARELTTGRSPTSPNPPRSPAAAAPAPAPPVATPAARSASMRAPGGAGMGGPVRGLSVRKPGAAAPPAPAPAPAPPAKDERMTQFYDDYLDSYAEEAPPPPLPGARSPAGADRVAAWAQSNANAAPRRAPSSYAPSAFGGSGGGSMRRRLTRRGTGRRAPSVYEEEEEGYVSGEYDDVLFELVKIRVKLHYADDVRGMALAPETPFEEFMEKVAAKFGRPLGGMALRFKDEDGGKVSLRDESDYELAIETARESSKGKPEGKLEIWVADM